MFYAFEECKKLILNDNFIKKLADSDLDLYTKAIYYKENQLNDPKLLSDIIKQQNY